MINPDKISWEQILSFFKVLRLSSSSDLATIKRWYERETKNFENTLSLLQDLGIIRLKKGRIISTRELKETLSLKDEIIRSFFIKVLFEDKRKLLESFEEFFDGFSSFEGSYVFVPNTQERLKHSGVRNFLISLGVLEFNQKLRGYTAKEKLSHFLGKRIKVFSYKEFLKKNARNKELGSAAEMIIYEYEKNLFQDDILIQKKIRHVSLENVLAGYDILSFRKLKNGVFFPRHIEVKAVSMEDWKFYWSRNEIDKAKILGKSYYLYLLPVDQGGILNIASICQIEDPYHRVFLNKKDWLQEVEVFLFRRNEI